LADPHKRYERKQFIWLLVTYVVIAIMSAALMIYAALMSGTRPAG